jgi:hypothetical protein
VLPCTRRSKRARPTVGALVHCCVVARRPSRGVPGWCYRGTPPRAARPRSRSPALRPGWPPSAAWCGCRTTPSAPPPATAPRLPAHCTHRPHVHSATQRSTTVLKSHASKAWGSPIQVPCAGAQALQRVVRQCAVVVEAGRLTLQHGARELQLQLVPSPRVRLRSQRAAAHTLPNPVGAVSLHNPREEARHHSSSHTDV